VASEVAYTSLLQLNLVTPLSQRAKACRRARRLSWNPCTFLTFGSVVKSASTWRDERHHLHLDVHAAGGWKLDLPTRSLVLDLMRFRAHAHFGGPPAVVETMVDKLDGISTDHWAVILPVLRSCDAAHLKHIHKIGIDFDLDDEFKPAKD